MAAHFPHVENVETPLGPAEDVWATSDTHIGMRGTFTINRVKYRIRLDLHYRDGLWQKGDKDDWSAVYHALMIDRVWDYPNGRKRPDTSSSAREKANTALVPWLASFAMNEGAEIVRNAGIARAEQTIASKRETIAKLRNDIEQAERELAALENPA